MAFFFPPSVTQETSVRSGEVLGLGNYVTVLFRGRATPFYTVVCNSTFTCVVL